MSEQRTNNDQLCIHGVYVRERCYQCQPSTDPVDLPPMTAEDAKAMQAVIDQLWANKRRKP